MNEPPRPVGEWDLMRRDYLAAQRTPVIRAMIQDQTGIVPAGVARAVCEEAGRLLGASLPGEWVAELVEHAEVVYQHNARFRRLLGRGANAGRDWLWAFTRHWLWAIIASRHPHLLSRLPSSYAIGGEPCSGSPSACPSVAVPANTTTA